MTPAAQAGRRILLSEPQPFVLLFTPVGQFPPSSEFRGLGTHTISIKEPDMSPQGILGVQVQIFGEVGLRGVIWCDREAISGAK